MFRRNFGPLGLFLLVALTGCAGSEPYYLGRFLPNDNKVEVGLGRVMNDPVTGRPYFSVCYSSMLHSAEQVRSLVQKHCGDPQLRQNITDLYSCSVSAPVRATYSCSALSRTAEEARPNLIRNESSLGVINLY